MLDAALSAHLLAGGWLLFPRRAAVDACSTSPSPLPSPEVAPTSAIAGALDGGRAVKDAYMHERLQEAKVPVAKAQQSPAPEQEDTVEIPVALPAMTKSTHGTEKIGNLNNEFWF